MRIGRARIRRRRDGAIDFRIGEQERELIKSLLPQMQELLAVDDPSLTRLFPPAYANDAERDAEYRRLTRDDLLASRFSDFDVVERTVAADRLEEAEAEAWMRALNGLRLVLGTRLDVTEDMDRPEPDDPEAPAFAVYEYLSMVVSELVDALAEG
ncbi:MAG: DUF2017 family protein [Acidimicrobiales bacterium]